MLTGHSGAWELMGLATSRDLGLPITVIVRQPASESVRARLETLRRRIGLEVLSPSGSFFQAAKAYDQGRVVVFLLDQRHNKGEPLQFFGRPAWTSRGLALLSARKNAPVFGAWATRTGLGRHLFVLYDKIPRSGETLGDTQAMLGFTEERIRECPEEWLWLHDRWRNPEEGR